MQKRLVLIESLVMRGLLWLIGLGRMVKFALVLAMDAFLCALAVWIAFSLRLGEWDLWTPAIGSVLGVALPLWLAVFIARGIYRSIVRFAGSRTMIKIASSCLVLMLAMSIILPIAAVPGVPRTVAIIQPIIFMVLLVTSRLVARFVLFDLINYRRFTGTPSNVLIYGAGSAGRQLALSLAHDPSKVLRGYIDDDDRLNGQHLDGVRIHHGSGIARAIARHEVDTVLIAIPRLSRNERERIVRSLDGFGVRVLTLPAMEEIVDGKVSMSDMREIEVADLLGRDPVPPNELLLRSTVANNTVMITGAGGSIGGELCRQISALSPAAIVLVEMTEHALYSIESELIERQKEGHISDSIRIHAELCNISVPGTVERLFNRWEPSTVFHAAAYKHVPLIEENAIAGMYNNIFGTLACALQAERSGVRNFILVSTDKAVRPTNIMGATKRVCELVLQALTERGSSTRFTMVRFGNVLGSSGSVVPRFQRQIRAGGPVTLTHRDITRYFMTIPEAAQLVIQAGAMGEGGDVFLLDMGEPVRIYDLARSMINLSGLTVRDAENPDGDIEICEVGLRPGEKLYEELLIGSATRATKHPQIFKAREKLIPWDRLSRMLEQLRDHLEAGDRDSALAVLRDLVPEYTIPPQNMPKDALTGVAGLAS